MSLPQCAPDTLPPVLAENLFDDSDYPSFSVIGKDGGNIAIEAIAANGDSALLRVKTLRACSSFPKVQVHLRQQSALCRGNILLARFMLRARRSALESGEVTLQFEIENTATSSISTQFAAFAASQWQEFWVPLRLVSDTPMGALALNLRVGSAVQELEITGIRVQLYPHGTQLESLPATPVRPEYDGMAEDAEWRKLAQERIRHYRMAPLRIKVHGSTTGLENVHLRVEQKRHAYRFGSAVQATKLYGSGYDEGYAQAVKRFFNTVVFENDMKWRFWLEHSDIAVGGARWCVANGISLRGHTLVWPSLQRLPDALRTELSSDPQKLRDAVAAHIKTITAATASYVTDWDVINEPFRNNDFMRLLGDEIMVEWFEQAQGGAPGSHLFLNDFGIVTGGGMDDSHQAHYEELVQFLLAKGAPLHGLGFQGHFGRILTPPERMLAILDRFARLGLPMQMTEYSIHLEDRELAAQYMCDVLTVFFSHPATSAFLLWCFREPDDFHHNCWLQEPDGSLTASGRAWLDLIYKRWWTREKLMPAADGTAELRVFHGLHEVTLLHGDTAVQAVRVEVGPQGAELEFRLP